jgi:multidrug efflux pump subunit AcrA (membrane-fusion protein)
MCVRVSGWIKWAALGGLILAFFLAGWGRPGAGYAQKAAPPQPPPAKASWDKEIIFNGKIYCSLTRRIDLPFKGVITAIRVHSGEQVKAGQVLATYRLAPESILAIQGRLAPPAISDTKVKLEEVERSLVPLNSQHRELSQLVPKKLATPQSLAQVNQSRGVLQREKTTLQESLDQNLLLAKQDRRVLTQLLGTSLAGDKVPREVSLKSPIAGHVIWINPLLRVGAELNPLPAAFQVGVMNPMVVRGQAFEIEALKIKIGDSAEITLDSLPGRKFQAKVSRVSWSSTTTGLETPAYYEVELTVPNPDLVLKDGLKARIVLHQSK